MKYTRWLLYLIVFIVLHSYPHNDPVLVNLDRVVIMRQHETATEIAFGADEPSNYHRLRVRERVEDIYRAMSGGK